MRDDDIDRLADMLGQAYKMKQWDSTYDDLEYADAVVSKNKFNHAGMLRDVMHELHKQGQGLDTLLTLKNDMLREWWSGELAKIKHEEAKHAAREKAKDLFSEEERKLLGMKF